MNSTSTIAHQKTEQTENIESRIIEAAKQEFIKKGFEQTSMSDIAAVVGINRPTLHYYFRTKDKMFQAVFASIVAKFLPHIDTIFSTQQSFSEKLEDVIRTKKITDPQDVREELKLIIEDILSKDDTKLDVSHSPTIILMVGVNGVGKTTTIGKLAHRYKSEGKKVLLAAGDTFRAAAIDQLEVWANRCNVDIIKHQEGADPGAVIFDAIKASKARGVDVLICDTAGRLHNKSNLMNELGKVFKIVDREYPEAKKEVLLVVDATTGQNAVSQAKSFKEVCDITGLALTKLDGTAKGGVILAVKSEVDVPVKLIGVGEKMEDLQDFDSKSFVDALFS